MHAWERVYQQKGQMLQATAPRHEVVAWKVSYYSFTEQSSMHILKYLLVVKNYSAVDTCIFCEAHIAWESQ